ncbi:uncharacterized protein YvpB [Pullulanibacillus pueri]|uniref:SH3 domain-containing protein n=1 Tax=Pullulanibacillus pueri TaxID=1437324 RepID=A0A8J3EMD0_9BACL|nr:C39 family peptidase [Pullulanibacillus pueri]MBM7682885.1 uncharacterized protein YvpB [Pullulanibacillus pueri]GGH84386.1 hypothetical protein GCM10007096_27340 [Pullulanibacillus pueri]
MKTWGLFTLVLLSLLFVVSCEKDQTQSTTQQNGVKEKTTGQALKEVEVNGNVETEALEKKRIKTTTLNKVMVTTAATKVTGHPGSEEQVIETLKKGEVVIVFEKADIDADSWYHIHDKNKKTGWIKADEAEVPTSKILDVTLINQLPELPNGCEVTSLTMLLQSAGIDVDKMTVADKMKTVPFEENGLKGDPNEGFVGNMYHGPPGYSVYHGPVADLAKQYLGNRVMDMTGSDWKKVEEQIIKGKPVWVIVNVQFKKLADSYWEDWKTKNGTMKVTMQEHSVLVTGFDEKNVYFNDPLAGIKNRKANKEDFKEAWEQQGKQAISYQ